MNIFDIFKSNKQNNDEETDENSTNQNKIDEGFLFNMMTEDETPDEPDIYEMLENEDGLYDTEELKKELIDEGLVSEEEFDLW